MSTLLIAFASICLSVLAQFCLKLGMGSEGVRFALSQPLSATTVLAVAASPGVLAGFALYGLGAVVWLAVLARWDVSKAYPLVGLGFVLTMVAGWVLGEEMSVSRVMGVVLVVAGVTLISRS